MTRGERKTLWLGLAFISPWIVGVLVFSAGIFSGMENHLRSAGGAGGVVALELEQLLSLQIWPESWEL